MSIKPKIKMPTISSPKKPQIHKAIIENTSLRFGFFTTVIFPEKREINNVINGNSEITNATTLNLFF